MEPYTHIMALVTCGLTAEECEVEPYTHIMASVTHIKHGTSPYLLYNADGYF